MPLLHVGDSSQGLSVLSTLPLSYYLYWILNLILEFDTSF